MKRTIKILKIGESRSGVSQKTGNEWKITEIDIAWYEQDRYGELHEQSAHVQLHGDYKKEHLQYHIDNKTEFPDTGLFFALSAFEGRSFNNIRCNLNKEAVANIPPL